MPRRSTVSLTVAGLHPVLLYSTGESILNDREDLKAKIMEGYWKWEEAYKTGSSPWTEDEVIKRADNCNRAIGVLWGDIPPSGPHEFVPDTIGGCMCNDAAECNSNPLQDGDTW